MNILKKAQQIVYERSEEKERQYGPMLDSMDRASKIASVLCNKEITSEDVLKVQMALKLSRESYAHKEDNLVDLVAYTSKLNDLHINKEFSRQLKQTGQVVIHFSDLPHQLTEEQIQMIRDEYAGPNN
jgi:maleate cis-trans isomerase